VDDFVKAWNSHDPKAFDRLFIDDAVWVPVAEARTEARKDIVKDFAEIHATWAETTTVSQSAKGATSVSRRSRDSVSREVFGRRERGAGH